MQLDDELCGWCRKPLPEDRHPRRMFCDKRCRNADYNKLISDARMAARAGRSCACCGKPIPATRRVDAEYCSRRCQRKTRPAPRILAEAAE